MAAEARTALEAESMGRRGLVPRQKVEKVEKVVRHLVL
jgi:hypothetical protein